MRHKKPFTIPSITLAALIGLLVASGGLASTQSPVPATKPAAAAIAPTATTPTAASAADEDIRDIRPPIHIPYGWLWAAYVAGGLALAGLTFAAWRWHQRYRQSRRKLLYELTLKGYQFSIAVSEIIRKYIEQQFHARAAHRTTEEFLHDLLTQSNTALAAHQPLLAEFLEHCDLAKFARWQHSVPQMQAMHHSACTFVVQTGKPAAPSVTESVTVAPLPMLIQPRST
jgi:hypothetical protein